MLRISEEVQKAIEENKPVVALESTIIAHGMPYPKNVETALLVEKVIRKHGVIPATIGIIDGEPIVGMSEEQIEKFGQRKDILKVSRRDLPYVLSAKKWDATTVATTMIFAAQAGIDVFVTGGIGGVHRHVEETFDISADLEELAKTSVTVICAGIKAILDLPKTLEYLETKGVTVIGYRSNHLASFYNSDSGLNVDYQMDEPLEIAKAMMVKKEYNLEGGMLISNPIPDDSIISKEDIDKAIELALDEEKKLGIHGKESTPFLLKKIVELTGGKSLDANIRLVLNNAVLGSEIAVQYALLKHKNM